VAKPNVVANEEWERARTELLVSEKEATGRRMPWRQASPAADGQVRRQLLFDTPTGPKSLLDLFEGRDQLVVYQFMDNGPDNFCPGCTAFTNNVTTWTIWPERSQLGNGSNMRYPRSRVQSQDGLDLPFVSSHGTSFAKDCGGGEGFMLSVFLRHGSDIYLTYSTRRAEWTG